jgi:hypothetical protein
MPASWTYGGAVLQVRWQPRSGSPSDRAWAALLGGAILAGATVEMLTTHAADARQLPVAPIGFGIR